jgi:hypothetical protein
MAVSVFYYKNARPLRTVHWYPDDFLATLCRRRIMLIKVTWSSNLFSLLFL